MEVWCRKKLERKETLQTGTSGKVLCMALNDEEEILLVGTADGKIQVKNLSVFLYHKVQISDTEMVTTDMSIHLGGTEGVVYV